MTTLETLLADPDSVGNWALVPDRSTIGFKIKNMWGVLPVKGKFTEFSGDGRLTEQGAVVGRIEIQVASLDTGIGRRDRHLRSADFFDADRFGQITVVVTGLEPANGKAAVLQTDFTIKGVTEPVRLPVTISELDDGSVQISGETEIDRFKFGVDFDKLGALAKTVTVSTQAVFVRAK